MRPEPSIILLFATLSMLPQVKAGWLCGAACTAAFLTCLAGIAAVQSVGYDILEYHHCHMVAHACLRGCENIN
jgi:hypothetical protein